MEQKVIQILIIEDNLADLELLKWQLSNMKLMTGKIQACHTLADAITKLKTDHFELLILDINLPDSTGQNTIKKIRNTSPSIPVVVLSGDDTELMENKAIELGVQDYLVKGKFEPYILERTIKYAISRQAIKTQLMTQNHQLTQLMTLETEYINMISHEIKNPLTIIEGNLYLLTNNPDIPLPQESELMLADINQQIERLQTLVKNILDLSKIEDAALPIKQEKIELPKFLDDITRFIQSTHAGKIGYAFSSTLSQSTLIADKEKLELIITNLAHNASKFTDTPEGRVTIIVDERLIKGQKHILGKIQDNGPGISEDDRNKLFKRFSKLTKKEGTGLGLTIAKKLATSMGGNITLESEIGKGTTFTFSIFQPRNKPKVVIISPNQDVIETITSICHDNMILPAHKLRGTEGIKLIASIQPDLILLDETQVGISAHDIIEKLKRKPGIDTIPIIRMIHDDHLFDTRDGSHEISIPIQTEELNEKLTMYFIQSDT